ncbi:MAG: ABC transporter ATP-binding protein [Eubacteriales bacterium]|nr:ABC transporter ATP-binding protein [Eubacteriales bacterium]
MGAEKMSPLRDPYDETPAAVFRNVSFAYPGTDRALIENLNFTIRQGEFVALIGPSGCGKSTILRLLNRLNRPVQGDVEIPGGHLCGYMPQQDLLFPWRTVLENIRLPLEVQGGLSAASMDARAKEILSSVGLEGWGEKLPRELSGGMRQRASFARTLMTGADLLLLDEPFSALDYLTRLSMREWLMEQWQRDKKTILFITHDVEEAVFLSTRILAADRAPIRSLREYRVPLPFPRKESDLAGPEALSLKAQLLDMFRECECVEHCESS